METAIKLNEELRAQDLSPLDRAKKEAEIKSALASAASARASAAATSQETSQKVKAAEAASKLSAGTKFSDLNIQTQLLLLGQGGFQDYQTAMSDSERISDEKEKDRVQQSINEAFKALARVGTGDESEADALEWNRKGPKDSNLVLYWDDGTGIFNTQGVERVELPNGWTLEDFRHTLKQHPEMTERQLIDTILGKGK